MEKKLTLNQQERKEFLKRPLGKALQSISVYMDRIDSFESVIEFESDDCRFVLTATKKKERDGKKAYLR